MWMLLFALSAHGQDDTTVVLSAAGQEIQMTRREVKKLFTRQELKWGDEDLMVVLPLLDSPEMKWLSKNVLGLPPEVYHRYLLEKAYRAGEDPPRFVAKPVLMQGEMVITVSDTQNAKNGGFTIIRVQK